MTEPIRRSWRLPRLRLSLLPLLLALLILIVVGVFYARSLTTPVMRTGHPAATVAPLPVPTPVALTPPTTPSSTPESSDAASPSATASSSSSVSATAPASAKSSGKFATASVDVPAVGATGTLHRYSVRVETSLSVKADKVARQIAGVLNDPRSWAGAGDVRFALVSDPKKAEFSISLASAATATKTCEPVAGSCRKGSSVLIVAEAWTAPPSAFDGASAWQAYLINHATGLYLGENAERCAKKGKPAPVMLDQSGDLGGCTANPWPNP